MKRTTCSGCYSDKLHKFLDLEHSPIADAYTESAEEIVKTYPLEVAVCEECYLVQLLEVVDSQTLFGTGYSFYSSSSGPLSAYHQRYAENVIERYGDDKPKFILEIGCNDGDMLRWFASYASFGRVLGVDPAEGPVAKARDRGLDVIQKEFTDKLAHYLRESYGPADVVIANHVLAHVADVQDMMHGIATMLARDGVAYVEVQYVGDLLVNNAFDLVYHEHRNFFSLASLTVAAEHAGLTVVDVEFTQRQQGSIRVQLQHWITNPHVAPEVADKLESEWWLRADLAAYDGMQGRVERVRTRLWDMLWDAVQLGRVAGYGAPAKATTLLTYCEIDNDVLDHIVDSTPAKQGRYVPGTGIPIIKPEINVTSPSTYLLLSWNYAHEIISREWDPDRQRWIVPLPAPLLL